MKYSLLLLWALIVLSASSCTITSSPEQVAADGSYALIKSSIVKFSEVSTERGSPAKELPSLHKLDGEIRAMSGLTHHEKVEPGMHTVTFLVDPPSEFDMLFAERNAMRGFSRFEFSYNFKGGRTYEVSAHRHSDFYIWRVHDTTPPASRVILSKKLPHIPRSKWYTVIKE